MTREGRPLRSPRLVSSRKVMLFLMKSDLSSETGTPAASSMRQNIAAQLSPLGVRS